ncbi:PLD nuclease N-terminal domain-containing protein [Actinomadura scrupuli]|uniref:PLD nuclease N-terminal domain-containing protein n=1 Tax=Actinomadura scrupuli TaxID=559629 RepID=UPI003D9624BE
MVFLLDGVGLLVLALWIFCIIDVITTDAALCRNLPKMLWLLIVLILPDVGSIVWLVAGRPRAVRDPGVPVRGGAGRDPGHGRAVPANPDDDEAFLRGLRERVEEQRRRAREQREADED